MSLELGKVYRYEDWMFVVVRRKTEFVWEALSLTRWKMGTEAGAVVEIFQNSSVGLCAREVA